MDSTEGRDPDKRKATQKFIDEATGVYKSIGLAVASIFNPRAGLIGFYDDAKSTSDNVVTSHAMIIQVIE